MKYQIGFVALGALALQASAGVVYSFSSISQSSMANSASGAAQLRMEVSDAGSGKVSFLFTNTGAAAMSITDVYFDDNALLASFAQITASAGVSFSIGASPGNLPGGNGMPLPFNTTAGLSADSDAPVQPNGVNPGEWLNITMNLLAGKSYADAITALNTAGDHLRVGIHVQGFGDGGSESFVNVIPTPSSLALAGLGGLLIARRRR